MKTEYVVRWRPLYLDEREDPTRRYVRDQRPEGSVDTTHSIRNAARFSREEALEVYYCLAHRLGAHKAVREWEVVPVTTEFREGDPI